MGIDLVPDQSPATPASSFLVEGNTVSGSHAWTGIYIPDAGFTDSAPVCLTNNTFNLGTSPTLVIVSPSSITQSCSN